MLNAGEVFSFTLQQAHKLDFVSLHQPSSGLSSRYLSFSVAGNNKLSRWLALSFNMKQIDGYLVKCTFLLFFISEPMSLIHFKLLSMKKSLWKVN